MAAVAALARGLGLRHALLHRTRTLLTVGGVATGVALVFSIQVMNATLTAAVGGVTDSLAAVDEVVVAAPTSAGLDEGVVDELRDTPGAEAAAPLLLSRTRLAAPDDDGDGTLALVVGATGDLLGRGGDAPRLDGDLGPDGAGLVLSSSLAERLDVGRGDSLRVATPAGHESVTVTGLVSGGDVENVNAGDIGVMDLAAAHALFGREGTVDIVLVRGDDAAALRDRIEEGFGGRVIVDGSIEEMSGTANVGPFTGITNLVGMVALLVGAFVVLNTMGMAVAERRRELALARTLGATPRELFRALIAEAVVLGLVATVIGVGIGWLLARVLVAGAAGSYEIALGGVAVGSPVVTPFAYAVAILAGVVVSVAGTAVPARQTLRVAPIESVRVVAPYEWAQSPVPGAGRRRTIAGFGLVALAAALALVPDDSGPSIAVAAAATVAALAGVVLLVPATVAVTLRLVQPVLRRRAGTVGRLAAESLGTNRRRTNLTVGVLVVALTLVIGLAGAVGAILERSDELARYYASAPIQVDARSTVSYTALQPLAPDVGERLADVPGVAAALPSQVAFVDVDGTPAVLYANPISEADAAGVLDQLDDRLQARDPDAFVDGLLAGDIAVSNHAADTLGLDVGGTVSLPTPSGVRRFTVAATFDDIAAVPAFTLDHSVYADLWGDDGVQRYQVVPEPGQGTRALAGIRSLVDDEDLPVDVQSRDAYIEGIRANVQRQFSITQAIQSAALIVAALSMAITFFTTVVQRRWEHALWRALGTSRRQLGRTLLLEAAVSALVGFALAAVAGVGLGWLMAEVASANFATTLDPFVPVATLGWCLGAALVATLCAVIYPRRVAMRTSIIGVLRSE